MRFRNLQNAFSIPHEGSHGARPDAYGRGDAQHEHPALNASTCRCRAGLMCPARATRPKPITTRCGRPRRWCRRGFCDYVPARHPALRYGIALNDRGYFWESQAVLEAVWAAAPQGGRERILLRACIQSPKPISGSGCKAACGRAAVRRGLERARSLGERKAIAAGDGFVEGFPTAALARLLKTKLGWPMLSKADWIAIAVMGRDMNQNAGFLSCGDWTMALI